MAGTAVRATLHSSFRTRRDRSGAKEPLPRAPTLSRRLLERSCRFQSSAGQEDKAGILSPGRCCQGRTLHPACTACTAGGCAGIGLRTASLRPSSARTRRGKTQAHTHAHPQPTLRCRPRHHLPGMSRPVDTASRTAGLAQECRCRYGREAGAECRWREDTACRRRSASRCSLQRQRDPTGSAGGHVRADTRSAAPSAHP
eukprot:3934094-Rhodomonas_salina.14